VKTLPKEDFHSTKEDLYGTYHLDSRKATVGDVFDMEAGIQAADAVPIPIEVSYGHEDEVKLDHATASDIATMPMTVARRPSIAVKANPLKKPSPTSPSIVPEYLLKNDQQPTTKVATIKINNVTRNLTYSRSHANRKQPNIDA
jgi:hypothetical protein